MTGAEIKQLGGSASRAFANTVFDAARLSRRQREIVKLRYGIGNDGIVYTLGNTAMILKMTISRVRSIESRALLKLQVLSLDSLGQWPEPA